MPNNSVPVKGHIGRYRDRIYIQEAAWVLGPMYPIIGYLGTCRAIWGVGSLYPIIG